MVASPDAATLFVVNGLTSLQARVTTSYKDKVCRNSLQDATNGSRGFYSERRRERGERAVILLFKGGSVFLQYRANPA